MTTLKVNSGVNLVDDRKEKILRHNTNLGGISNGAQERTYEYEKSCYIFHSSVKVRTKNFDMHPKSKHPLLVTLSCVCVEIEKASETISN